MRNLEAPDDVDSIVHAIADAIEAKPDYVREELAPLVAELQTTDDVRATLKKHLPDAEWNEAFYNLTGFTECQHCHEETYADELECEHCRRIVP